MQTIFNIGLEAKDAAGNVSLVEYEEVCEFVHELAGCGFYGALLKSRTEPTLVPKSHTEPTLVLEFDYAELRENIGVTKLAYRICERFHQECVAVYNTGLQAGQLIGPQAEAWGDFDNERFFLVNGDHPAVTPPEVLH